MPANDPQPCWYGYSVSRWEGNTLLVETNGVRDGGWLEINGTPFTDAGKVTERFRRVSFGRMEIDVTIEDPQGLHASVDGTSEPASHTQSGAH